MQETKEAWKAVDASGVHFTWCENLKGYDDCACHLFIYWTFKDNIHWIRILSCPKIRNFRFLFKADLQLLPNQSTKILQKYFVSPEELHVLKLPQIFLRTKCFQNSPSSQANIHICYHIWTLPLGNSSQSWLSWPFLLNQQYWLPHALVLKDYSSLHCHYEM